MKKIFLLFLTFLSSLSYSQISEGQNFCDPSKDGSYFPLAIAKKKILWSDTFYFETKEETKVINGKTYIGFKQAWDNSDSDMMYFREENGIIYQYDDDVESETVRFDPKFEKGHVWKTANGKNEYRLVTFEGKLKTPFCNYENLLAIEGKMSYGTFTFYYLKGHGYIGATKDGEVISCVTPKW